MYFVQSILQLPWVARKYPKRIVVSAMKLRPQTDYEPDRRWEFFIPQLQRSVPVGQYEIEEVGFESYQGRDVRSYNGEYSSRSTRENMLGTAQSLTRLYLFSPVASDDLPLFLCAEPGLQPHQYEVRVRILFETFDQLPDVQAWIGFVKIFLLRQFEGEAAVADEANKQDLLDRISQWEDREYSAANLLKVAAQITPFPGCYLPVETRTETGVTLGVLHLREELGGKEFLATLYLSDEATGLAPAARLWRSLHWQHGERSGDVQREIASVLAIDSVQPMHSAAS